MRQPANVTRDPKPLRAAARSALPCLLLLAAGRSRRLGRPKGALVAHGQPLLVQQLRKARRAGLTRAVVVLGAAAPRMEALLKPSVRTALGFHELRVCRTRAWREGMGGSLRDGLQALPRDWRRVLVLLVDQTGVKPAHLQRMIATSTPWKVAASTAAPGQPPQAPVMLPRRLLPEAIRRLSGDRGLGPWLRTLPPGMLARIPCAGAAEDVDTPAAAAAWRSRPHWR